MRKNVKNALREKDRSEEKEWCLFLDNPVGQRREIGLWLIPTFATTFNLYHREIIRHCLSHWVNQRGTKRVDNLDDEIYDE